MTQAPETKALRKDLDQLRKDFVALSNNVKHRSEGQAQAGFDKAWGRFQGIGGEIESRPVTSLVAAFGIGLLLGKLISH